MIRFEQDPHYCIEQIIREEVHGDVNGELYGVDRAVDAIMSIINLLQGDIEILKAKLEVK